MGEGKIYLDIELEWPNETAERLLATEVMEVWAMTGDIAQWVR
jgi:hypothetical protein